ncbi:hypothetical protein MH928_11080 [Flavobacterium sp. WW92]|uniref:hypothetical protein n=1 Tax=Flavobacterium TaxID=237 RepID=UPI001FE3BC25|nr:MULTISPECIES: hypothetical protein [Flavobacterium]WDO11872.1 hypothetical protein MH928_11080 [Flavobacterium sp. WW92]
MSLNPKHLLKTIILGLVLYLSSTSLIAQTKPKVLLASCERRGCSGAEYCSACKNCSGCRHCAKEGGTCGVCEQKQKKKPNRKKRKNKA